MTDDLFSDWDELRAGVLQDLRAARRSADLKQRQNKARSESRLAAVRRNHGEAVALLERCLKQLQTRIPGSGVFRNLEVGAEVISLRVPVAEHSVREYSFRLSLRSYGGIGVKSHDGSTFKTFEDLLDYLKETFLPAVATQLAEEDFDRELEARAGKRLDPAEVRVPCYACRGTGWSGSHRCSVCGGDGKY